MRAIKKNKKLKMFILIGATIVLFFSGVVIWASILAVSYVASKTHLIDINPIANEQLQNIKKEIQTLSTTQALSCWDKAQSLLAVQPWLEQSASVNIENLKAACLRTTIKSCQGQNCEQNKDHVDANQWPSI